MVRLNILKDTLYILGLLIELGIFIYICSTIVTETPVNPKFLAMVSQLVVVFLIFGESPHNSSNDTFSI